MIVAVCLDEKNGMMFNRRRQSQDRVLRENLASDFESLSMNTYSGKMFEKDGFSHVKIADNFLEEAEPGECCFVENTDIRPYLDKIEGFLVYQWNRTYPSDTFFPIDLTGGEWLLEKTEEFAGSSHEKISKYFYRKK